MAHWLKLRLPIQWRHVSSPVGDLRSHLPCVEKKNPNLKHKQYCNSFNKDFKYRPYKKNPIEKERHPLYVEPKMKFYR